MWANLQWTGFVQHHWVNVHSDYSLPDALSTRDYLVFVLPCSAFDAVHMLYVHCRRLQSAS